VFLKNPYTAWRVGGSEPISPSLWVIKMLALFLEEYNL
jgi:hypothetical protein